MYSLKRVVSVKYRYGLLGPVGSIALIVLQFLKSPVAYKDVANLFRIPCFHGDRVVTYIEVDGGGGVAALALRRARAAHQHRLASN